MRPFGGHKAKGAASHEPGDVTSTNALRVVALMWAQKATSFIRVGQKLSFFCGNTGTRCLAFKLRLQNHVGASKEGTMCTCRTALTAMSLAVLSLLCAPATQAQLQSGNAQTVTGQVSAVEGEFHMAKDYRGEDILKMVDKSYIVTTPAGQQIELKLTRETNVPARANPGDRIEAKITEKGQTLSVKLIGDLGETR